MTAAAYRQRYSHKGRTEFSGASGRASLVAALVFLAGCAAAPPAPGRKPRVPIHALQSECEQEYDQLSGVVACLERRVQVAPIDQTGAHLLRLYISYGHTFAERIDAGSITEEEGVSLWREAALRLNEIDKDRVKAQAMAASREEPQEMNLLSKIGYVLQATAAGARNAQIAPAPSGTGSASGLERWQLMTPSIDPSQTISSPRIASPTNSSRGCQKSWVCDDQGNNCRPHDLCDRAIALPSVGLAPLRPLPSVKLKPLPSVELPPLGTTSCEYKQVNGEWQNVCW